MPPRLPSSSTNTSSYIALETVPMVNAWPRLSVSRRENSDTELSGDFRSICSFPLRSSLNFADAPPASADSMSPCRSVLPSVASVVKATPVPEKSRSVVGISAPSVTVPKIRHTRLIASRHRTTRALNLEFIDFYPPLQFADARGGFFRPFPCAPFCRPRLAGKLSPVGWP